MIKVMFATIFSHQKFVIYFPFMSAKANGFLNVCCTKSINKNSLNGTKNDVITFVRVYKP